MIGKDVQQWETCKEKVESFGLQTLVYSESISLIDENENYLGNFNEVKDLYYFLLGYEYSYRKIKLSERN